MVNDSIVTFSYIHIYKWFYLCHHHLFFFLFLLPLHPFHVLRSSLFIFVFFSFTVNYTYKRKQVVSFFFNLAHLAKHDNLWFCPLVLSTGSVLVLQMTDIMFFFLMAEQNFIVYMAYIFLPNLSIDGPLAWLYNLALVTRIAINMDL